MLFVVPLACVLAGLALARAPAPLGLAVVVLFAVITLPEQAAVRRSHEQASAQLIDDRGAARVIAHGRLPQVTSPDAALAGVAGVWEVVPDALSSRKPEPQLRPAWSAVGKENRPEWAPLRAAVALLV